MTVRTYLPWECTATLRSRAVGSAARGASAPTEGGEGRGHIVAAPAQLVGSCVSINSPSIFLNNSVKFDTGKIEVKCKMMVQISNSGTVNQHETNDRK